MPQEKYPEKCPWDLGPKQKQSHLNEWTLMNGPESVKFSRDPTDEHWLVLTFNDELSERLLLFKARQTYQKLLDKGYKLQGE